MKINFLNYKFLSIDGYGRSGLGCVLNLLRSGVEVTPHTIDIMQQPAWFQQASGLDFSRATICLMPAYHLEPIPGKVLCYTMWEATKLEERWKIANERANVLMVPSEFLVEVFRDNGIKIPIEVVKLGIEPVECPIMPKKPVGDRPFSFMCLGDRGDRKGQDIVWQAFYKAFGASKDVRLVIKCRPGSMTNLDLTTSDRRISVWRCDVNNVSDVYANCDCYVFPTRGEGYGMTCFLPDARVSTEDGIRSIDSVQINDKVMSHSGKLKSVTEITTRFIDEEMLELELIGSNQHIRLTSNHRLLAYKRIGRSYGDIKGGATIPEWTEASQLSNGDFVFMPKKQFNLETKSIIDLSEYTDKTDGEYLTNRYTNRGENTITARDVAKRANVHVSAARHTLNEELDHVSLSVVEKVIDAANELKWSPIYRPNKHMPLNEDTGFLFGQYTAEGSVGRNGDIEFGSHNKEADIRKRLAKILCDTWRLPSHEETSKSGGNGARLSTTCRSLSEVLTKTCGKGAYNKKIPEFIYNNIDFARGYLIGVWLGDGSFSCGYTYSTVSEQLGYQLRELLSAFGVISSLDFSKKRHAWTLRVSGHSEKIFLSLFGKEVQDKVFRSPYIEVDGGWLVPIRNITRNTYTGYVYNLEVEDDHSYCVENIAVHNCREAAACGTPTITTRWGGTADDIDNYAIPINNFKMIESNLPGKGLWADPDVDEVVHHMKWVFENQELAFKQAKERAEWLHANRTYMHTAQRLIEMVNRWS